MSASLFISGNTSVTGGDGAYGAWTTVFTPPSPLCGFYLGFTTSAYGIFNLFIGSGTPGTPQVENGCFDTGVQGMVYFPFEVAAGVPIQIQAWNFNSTTDAILFYVLGLPQGVRKSHNTCQVLGTSTTDQFTALATTATQFGTLLGTSLKRMAIVGGNSSSGTTGSYTVSIGSTGATNILQNVNFGDPTVAYISAVHEFDVDLPPSQDIWITSTTATSRAMLYLFY